MKLFRKSALLAILLCFSTILAQNTTCTDIVTQALAAVQDVCAATGRNQACYGNISIQATPRDNSVNFSFEQQGDLVNVADVQSLRLRQLDVEQNTWGIAMMKIQADLPEALPGQNVTFLMFGDVEIENAVDPGVELATLEATAVSGANIRTLPSTNGQIAGSLVSGETVTTTGRNADGSWLRIQIPDSDSQGWVSASLLSASGDIMTLSVAESLESEIPYTPMQAFYFRTGIADPLGCAEAPPNGLLIQTPDGVGEINLRANDVDIKLGSTAYLRAIPGAEMTISVIEGQGEITSMGETVVVPAGASVGVPIDEELNATGAPEDLVPYDADSLMFLPIEVLPEEFEIAPPADEEIILDAQAAIDDVAAPGGDPGGDTGSDPGAGDGGEEGGGGGVIAGGMFDPGMFAGMDPGFFCPLLDQSLAEAGMSRQEYIGYLREVIPMLGESDAAGIEDFIALLESCP